MTHHFIPAAREGRLLPDLFPMEGGGSDFLAEAGSGSDAVGLTTGQVLQPQGGYRYTEACLIKRFLRGHSVMEGTGQDVRALVDRDLLWR